MNADLERIAERRRLLVSQAAAQRFVLGQEMALASRSSVMQAAILR